MKHLSGSTAKGAKEDRGSVSHHRSVCIELSPGGATLQNGNIGVCSSSHQEPRMDRIHRHKRDAYFHVPMHRDIKSTWTPDYLSDWQCLLEFTKLLRPVVAWLRQQGVKLHVYLDIWLICAESPEQAQMHSEMTIALHLRLGWVINFEKSDLTPSEEFQFLGMHFNTRQFTVAVAPLPKMYLKIQHWMSNPIITARDLRRLLGMVVFMATLVRHGRLRVWPVQWWAATAWCQRTGNWTDKITVPQWALQKVAWWASPAVLQGLPLATQETEVTLFTDASN